MATLTQCFTATHIYILTHAHYRRKVNLILLSLRPAQFRTQHKYSSRWRRSTIAD